MLKNAKLLLITFVLLTFSATSLFAAGFNLYEHGARSMALAGAFVAQADDASAIFYNPAGTVHLEGWNTYTGVTIVAPSSKFTGDNPYPGFGVQEETKARNFFPPGLYITKKVQEKLAVGFGIFAPFAIGTEWENPDTFTGRYLSQKTELAGIYFSPSVSYKYNDMISFGVNLNFVYSTLELKQMRNQAYNGMVLDVADMTIEGDNGMAFGFDIGTMIKVNPQMQIGLLYRSEVKNDYTGDAIFDQILTGSPAVDAIIGGGLPMNGSGENEIGIGTSISFPAQIVAGIMYKPIEALTLEFDFVSFGWSAFDELVFDFAAEKESDDLNTPENSTIEENYEDVIQLRLGVDYQVTPTLSLQVGYVYDESPVPNTSLSPLLPDNDRNDFSFGVGYDFGKYHVDAAYMLVDFGERSTEGEQQDNFNGSYISVANLFALSLGYHF